MATRPVFLPSQDQSELVKEISCEFVWSSGFAESQKRKNIIALHEAANEEMKKLGIDGRLLEISTKSEDELGRRLSAFSLKLEMDGELCPLESVYQSAKVFSESGSFPEIRQMQPRDAKRFIAEYASEDLVAFKLDGEEFPLSPKTAFYDWIYLRSLAPHEDWITERIKSRKFRAFTDIEFNPKKQENCQARAFARFLSLAERSEVQKASDDFKHFLSLLPPEATPLIAISNR